MSSPTTVLAEVLAPPSDPGGRAGRDGHPAHPERERDRRRLRRSGDREDLHPRRRPRRLAAAGYRVIGAALAGIAAQELQSTAGDRVVDVGDAADRPRHRPHHTRRPHGARDRRSRHGRHPQPSPRSSTPPTGPGPRSCWSATLTSCRRSTPGACSPVSPNGSDRSSSPHNRRQRQQWERDALAELRAGDIDVALTAYADNGRIVTGANAIEVRRAIVADWWSYRLAGDTTTMTAFRRDDVDDLNGRARAYLARAGTAPRARPSRSTTGPTKPATRSSVSATTAASASTTAPEPPSRASIPTTTPSRSGPTAAR